MSTTTISVSCWLGKLTWTFNFVLTIMQWSLRECITEKVTEGKCATDQALDTTDMVEVPNETLYSCLTFGRRKRL